MGTNPWLWLEYRRLQAMLNRTTDAQRAEGIESAMTTVLEKIKGSLSCSSQQIKNLVGNRISKERRRRAIAYRSREEIVPQIIASSGAADSRLMLQRCAEICGLRDFTLLVKNAQGYTFGELATASGIAQNTLKVRAYRARRSLATLLDHPL